MTPAPDPVLAGLVIAWIALTVAFFGAFIFTRIRRSGPAVKPNRRR